MKQGFSLIELVIAIAISAILGGMMYTCLTQSQRTVAAVECVTDIIMKTIIIQKQMTRDISGAYIPLSVLEPQKSVEPEPKQPSAEPNQKKQPSPEPQKPAQKESDTEQKEALKKALETTFNGIRENDQCKQLTIVTHNPLEIFWSNKAGRPKCRSEKVVYTVEAEKGTREPAYKLIRSTTYTKDNKEVMQKHELATGIKKIDITYTCIVTDEGEKKAESPEQKKKPQEKDKASQKEAPAKKIVKTFSDWSVKEMNEDDIRLQKKIPQYVTILIELWSPLYDKFESFTYIIPIMWEELTFKQAEQKKGAPKKEPSLPAATQGSKTGPLPAVSNKK